MHEMILGIFAGVLARAIFPYLVKLKKNPSIKWNNKYLISAFAGLLISIIVALLIYFPLGNELSFGVAFVTAYTLHSVSREVQRAFKD